MIKFKEISHVNNFDDYVDIVIPCTVEDERGQSLEDECVFVGFDSDETTSVTMNNLSGYYVDFNFTEEEVVESIRIAKESKEYCDFINGGK